LDHFDRAHVMSAAALGIHHPEVVSATLARADLAWDLDQRDYAAGLYRVLVNDLEGLGDDEAAARARARRSE
ncbi:MAG: hypothetical protein KC457_29580, partial [Myxococcales bacterium]|nr:hypothetical protein [Myxococcales bacterium]